MQANTLNLVEITVEQKLKHAQELGLEPTDNSACLPQHAINPFRSHVILRVAPSQWSWLIILSLAAGLGGPFCAMIDDAICHFFVCVAKLVSCGYGYALVDRRQEPRFGSRQRLGEVAHWTFCMTELVSVARRTRGGNILQLPGSLPSFPLSNLPAALCIFRGPRMRAVLLELSSVQ